MSCEEEDTLYTCHMRRRIPYRYMSYEEEDTCHMRRRITYSSTHGTA
jgi:hypothetical protein